MPMKPIRKILACRLAASATSFRVSGGVRCPLRIVNIAYTEPFPLERRARPGAAARRRS